MRDINPLEKRFQDNQAKKRAREAVLAVGAIVVIAATLVVFLMSQAIRNGTETILNQTDIIKRQNKLIECLVRADRPCDDEERAVREVRSTTPGTSQSVAEPRSETRVIQGVQGKTGAQGERGPSGEGVTGTVGNVIEFIGGLVNDS